ncbi:hypothetical protein WIW50_03710 [Flavobacteriaceae bacterium 3-367]
MKRKAVYLALAIFSFGQLTHAQESKSHTMVFKKGQSMDILSFIQNVGTEEALKEYFGNVFPLANKEGFKIDGTFLIQEPPTWGNYHPGSIIFMSWPSNQARANFRREAKKSAYNYIAARRKIWKAFHLTEYTNLAEDVSLTLHSDKVYVITAYWLQDSKAFNTAKKEAMAQMKAAGGELLLSLGKGESPNGYLYEPDVISITEWDHSDTFKAFMDTNNSGNPKTGIKNMNQWVTTFAFK